MNSVRVNVENTDAPTDLLGLFNFVFSTEAVIWYRIMNNEFDERKRKSLRLIWTFKPVMFLRDMN
jgi:uncharacterized membrane protein